MLLSEEVPPIAVPVSKFSSEFSPKGISNGASLHWMDDRDKLRSDQTSSHSERQQPLLCSKKNPRKEDESDESDTSSKKSRKDTPSNGEGHASSSRSSKSSGGDSGNESNNVCSSNPIHQATNSNCHSDESQNKNGLNRCCGSFDRRGDKSEDDGSSGSANSSISPTRRRESKSNSNNEGSNELVRVVKGNSNNNNNENSDSDENANEFGRKDGESSSLTLSTTPPPPVPDTGAAPTTEEKVQTGESQKRQRGRPKGVKDSRPRARRKPRMPVGILPGFIPGMPIPTAMILQAHQQNQLLQMQQQLKQQQPPPPPQQQQQNQQQQQQQLSPNLLNARGDLMNGCSLSNSFLNTNFMNTLRPPMDPLLAGIRSSEETIARLLLLQQQQQQKQMQQQDQDQMRQIQQQLQLQQLQQLQMQQFQQFAPFPFNSLGMGNNNCNNNTNTNNSNTNNNSTNDKLPSLTEAFLRSKDQSIGPAAARMPLMSMGKDFGPVSPDLLSFQVHQLQSRNSSNNGSNSAPSFDRFPPQMFLNQNNANGL